MRLDARLELRMPLLQRIVDQILPRAIAGIADAFEARAAAGPGAALRDRGRRH